MERVLVFSDYLLDALEHNVTQVVSLSMNSPNFFYFNRFRMMQVMGLMRNILFLDISTCKVIENMQFLLGMPKLKHFAMNCVSVLNTDSFMNILPQCESIETLSCKGNRFVTMTETRNTCCHLVNLKFLDLQGTCEFIPSYVRDICNACPQLKTFLFSPNFRSKLYQQWISVVNVEFQKVNFHYTTYQQVTRFEKLLARQRNLNNL